MGYKNAPDIEPRIGDVVKCGLGTAIVASIDKSTERPRTIVINCAVNGSLHLNLPEAAVLVRTADGITPEDPSECTCNPRKTDCVDCLRETLAYTQAQVDAAGMSEEQVYAEEKEWGQNCCNHSCQFWDELYEQHCSAAHSDGEPYIDDCEQYIPEKEEG